MILQPRHITYKRRQKKRSLLSFNNTKNILNFGNSGLMLLRPVHLTAFQIFRYKLFLKRASRKPDVTRRFVWFNAFPHLPLTRKPNGVRMGKGKGKLECWFTNVSGGTMLIELKNLRRGRSIFFMTQLTAKLGIRTKFIFATKMYLPFPISISRRVSYNVFKY